ncbi:2Fe-2S iron-sulfur cluster binding domain-containing protein [Pseudomaricurvus alkylphenolicus]|uniref:2Fe-2S iron-sulfur cluster-binding protein n=1 Tax=Pseudomaricurvus alkylphenolicus TaxID=1306991 RepID=UPI0014216CF2|nr:2Fe-2S iron-sulfur cluster-binding protein [Pseudomaricurvus alkylphenolicus]NIB43439.1 2Fe-2S iron-sulfur cluster binding domain-containing protein [Pseudomaricurvus alkylphenolicus]
MPIVTFLNSDGSAHNVDAPAGSSLMEAAVDNLIPGILAECGGACACATCHCYVDEQWLGKVAVAGEEENQLLSAVLDQRSNSRLSCQINLSEELDGLVVHLPESQY